MRHSLEPMRNLEKNSSSEAFESYEDTEELGNLVERYKTAANQYEQLSPYELDAASPNHRSSHPTRYIKLYAEINDQTPLDEAREKAAKIEKAIAIDELRSRKTTYTEEEKEEFFKEIFDYFYNNKNQYDLITNELDESGTYPDGRVILNDGLHIYDTDTAELFWNLQNDNMSTEAWAYFCDNGTMENYEYIDDNGHQIMARRLHPVFSPYEADRKKRIIEINDRQLRRASRPDIFGNPDEKLIKSNTKSILKKISSGTVHEILRKDGENFRDFNEKTVSYLSAVFGLAETPYIKYEIKTGPDDGSYSRKDNAITFYYQEGRNEIITYEDINTIVHEMWHAYQHSIADQTGTELNSELYKKNFTDYIQPKEDYLGYRTQFVEKEAETFADSFIKRYCLSMMDRLRMMKTGHGILASILKS